MIDQPTPAGDIPLLEPKPIKVFGILHLVFGGMGIIQILFAIITSFFQDKLAVLSAGGDEKMAQMQVEMFEKLRLSSYLSIVIMVLVTVMIMRAGLSLVKMKKGAIQKSNQYVWVSLGAKVILLILGLFFTIPVANEFYAGMFETAESGGAQAEMIARLSNTVGVIAGPILGAIYPIVALIFLNKPPVKSYLAQHGKE